MKLLIYIVFLFAIMQNWSYSQNNQGRDIDNIFFIGEQEIDSLYMITFLPLFHEKILIHKSELNKIQDHKTFHTIILQTGAFFINKHQFYRSFFGYFLSSDLLSGRNDSALFMNYCKIIADDANLNTAPIKYGPYIINNRFMQVRQIYENRFFVAIARMKEFNNFFQSESLNYSTLGISNLYVRFLVPLRDMPERKEKTKW